MVVHSGISLKPYHHHRSLGGAGRDHGNILSLLFYDNSWIGFGLLLVGWRWHGSVDNGPTFTVGEDCRCCLNKRVNSRKKVGALQQEEGQCVSARGRSVHEEGQCMRKGLQLASRCSGRRSATPGRSWTVAPASCRTCESCFEACRRSADRDRWAESGCGHCRRTSTSLR